MSTIELRPELEAIPKRMQRLKIFRGYPVPWFVGYVNGEPEFRVADAVKFRSAIRDKRCWVCGESLGPAMTFVAGPMCGINRTSAEPPCHLGCAQWSARNCPFLSRPNMVRRDNNLPEGAEAGAGFGGIAILRNPGVTLLWTTRDYTIFSDRMGGTLIRMGEPTATEWWAEGKPATREQVEASVAGGLPNLEAMAIQEPGAMRELQAAKQAFEKFYPKP